MAYDYSIHMMDRNQTEQPIYDPPFLGYQLRFLDQSESAS